MRVVACVTLAGFLSCAPAFAYVVDSTGDAPDATPGDGLCATTLGECTLRAAIEESNATPGLGFVQLATRHYLLTLGELAVTDDLQIFTPGTNVATIEGSGVGRVLHVLAGVSASLDQVVVTGGSESGVAGGAGILNEGRLALHRVAITRNTGSLGAGLRNTGSVDADQTYVEHNGPGPAVLNEGTIDLTQGDVSGNDGIGLENRLSATLDFVSVDHNAGGGIFNNGPSAAYLSVDRSSLTFNQGHVGALLTNGSTAHLKRTTVSGNTGDVASAIQVTDLAALTLESVTVGANGRSDSPCPALRGAPTANIRAISTIVGGNIASGGDPDCVATVTSLGHNLMSCALTAPDPTTITGDPRLGPLRSLAVLWPATGFQTLVHGLLPGSPAIDRGVCLGWPDQRGTDRPPGGRCDIGAFETTPLCSGGVGMAGTRLNVRRKPLPGGRTTVTLRGTLLFSTPGDPPANPAADGLQLRVEAESPAGAFLERTVLTEPLIAGGWTPDASMTRFRWKTIGPVDGEKLIVNLADRRATGGMIGIKAKAVGLLPPTTSPLRVTIVLGGDLLGLDRAGDAGACAEQVVVCTSDAAGLRLKCR